MNIVKRLINLWRLSAKPEEKKASKPKPAQIVDPRDPLDRIDLNE